MAGRRTERAKSGERQSTRSGSTRTSKRSSTSSSGRSNRAGRSSTARRPGRRTRRQRSLRRWAVIIGSLLFVLIAVIWWLPGIVALTPLADNLIGSLLEDVPATVRYERLSLGWLAPIRLEGVTVHDHGDKPRLVAEIDEVITQRALIDLIRDRSRLGVVTIRRPRVQVVVKNHSTNVEQLLKSLLENPVEEGPRPTVSIRVEDARVDFVNSQDQPLAALDRSDLELTVPVTGRGQVKLSGRLLTAKAARAVLPNSKKEANFTAEASWPLDATAVAGGGTAAAKASLGGQLKLTDLDLRSIAPLWSRLGLAVTTDGEVSGTVHWRDLGEGAHGLTLENVVGREIEVTAPRWIGDDHFATQRLSAGGEVRITEQAIRFRALNVTCDLAEVHADGQWEFAHLETAAEAADPQAAWWTAADQDVSVRADVDLVGLSQVLPHTMHLREGVSWTSGQMAVVLTSNAQGQMRRWDARIVTSDLAGRRGEKEFRWPQPIRVELTAIRDSAGVRLERLDGQASFLRLESSGTPQQGTATLSANLDQLADQLRPFVEVDDFDLGGTITASGGWTQVESNVKVTADVATRQLSITPPGGRSWREEALRATVAATVKPAEQAGGRPTLLDAQLTLAAANDTLQLNLAAPETAAPETGSPETGGRPAGGARWPATGRIRGDVARWLARLPIDRALTDRQQVGGTLDIAFELQASDRQVRVSKFAGTIQHLTVTGPDYNLVEPEVQIDAELDWDSTTRRLTTRHASVAGTIVAVRATDFAAQAPPAAIAGRPGEVGWHVAGKMGYRADIAPVVKWFHPRADQGGSRFDGHIEGQLRLEPTDSGSRVQTTMAVTNLILQQVAAEAGQPARWQTVWQQPQGAGSLTAQWDSRSQRLVIERGELSTDREQLALTVAGEVNDLSGTMDLNLRGEVGFDLAVLAEYLRPQAGPTLVLEGRQRQAYQIHGRLRPPSPQVAAAGNGRGGQPPATARGQVPADVALSWTDLKGDTRFGWQAAQWQGVVVGPATLPLKLSDGVARVTPTDVVASGGRLRVAPQLALRDRPTLWVPAGPLAENLNISPEMCRGWFKYIAPLLADATTAEGRFSVELAEPAAVPLSDWNQATTGGSVHVHAGQLGPGPLARQLLGVVEQVKAVAKQRPPRSAAGARVWLKMEPQVIGFRLDRGRVYHDGLTLVIDDVTVRTKGLVGLDESLDLVAQLPIPDKWVGDNPALAGLRGKVLDIPIRGTFGKPKFDFQLPKVGRQFLEGAAGRLLEQQLQRGLKSLFGN